MNAGPDDVDDVARSVGKGNGERPGSLRRGTARASGADFREVGGIAERSPQATLGRNARRTS